MPKDILIPNFHLPYESFDFLFQDTGFSIVENGLIPIRDN